MQKNSTTFFVKLLKAMEPIIIPDPPILDDGIWGVKPSHE